MRVTDNERLLVKAQSGNYYYVQQVDEGYKAGWVHKDGVTIGGGENCDWQTPLFTRNDAGSGSGGTWMVRSQPRIDPCTVTDQEVVSGERLRIRAESGDWYYVQQVDENFKAGWVEKAGVTLGGDDGCSLKTPSASVYDEVMLPVRNNVTIRTRPSTSSCTDTGTRVGLDDRVNVRTEQEGWFYIDAITDRNGNRRNFKGWIRRSDLGTNEAVRAYWTNPTSVAWNLDVDFRVTDATDDVFFSHQFLWNAGGGGYMGLQQLDNGERKLIFSFWSEGSSDGPGYVESHNSDQNCERAPSEDDIVNPLRCLNDFDWVEGRHYTFRLWRLGQRADGVAWRAAILDSSGNTLRLIGDFVINADMVGPPGTPHGIIWTATFIEDFDNIRDCSNPASTKFHISAPRFNNGRSASTYEDDSVSPCSAGSSRESTTFPGGRELRFNAF